MAERVPMEYTDISADPWKHRSRGMHCLTCMWFVQKPYRVGIRVDMQEEINRKHKIGRCRRHSPTMSGYPVVCEEDWCGDHKLDETKV